MHISRLAVLVLLIGTVLIPSFASAQGSLPTVRLDPQTIQQGDTFTYFLEDDGPFSFSGAPRSSNSNIRIFTEPSYRDSRIVGNKLTRQAYGWQIVAVEEGPFTIQPPQVTVDGKTVKLPSISGEIKPVQKPEFAHFENAGTVRSNDPGLRRQYSERFFTTLEIDDKEPYLYQPVRLTTYLYREELRDNLRAKVNVVSPVTGRQIVLAEGSDQLLLNGNQSTFSQESVSIEGRRFIRSPIQSSIIIPTSTGRIDVGGAELQLTLGQIDWFFGPSRTFAISPPTATMNVQPLPPRPDDVVTQLNGNFTIGVTADRESVDEGDLITLTIAISGSGYLETVSLDNMPDIPGLTFISQEIEHRNNQGNGRNDEELFSSKSFHRVYQTTMPGTITVPSLKFAMFNPDNGEQVIRDTSPIEIEVAATAKSSLSFTSTAPPNPDRGEARILESGGIMYIDTQPITGGRASMGGQPLALRPAFWLAHAIPLFLLVGWCGLYARRRRLEGDVDAMRTRASRQRAHAALKEAQQKKADAPADQFYSAISAGLLNHIASLIGRPAAGLTADDAVHELRVRNAQESLVTELRRLLELCDEKRYAPASEDTKRNEDLSAAQDLISQLNRIKK